MDKQDKERLVEIRNSMRDMLEEAGNIIRRDNSEVYRRAKYTWIGNIDAAIGGGNFISNDLNMKKTLIELYIDPDLNEQEDDEEYDDEDEDEDESKD